MKKCLYLGRVVIQLIHIARVVSYERGGPLTDASCGGVPPVARPTSPHVTQGERVVTLQTVGRTFCGRRNGVSLSVTATKWLIAYCFNNSETSKSCTHANMMKNTNSNSATEKLPNRKLPNRNYQILLL